MSETKHILGLSGGKDSAALAVHMNKKYPDLNIEYFFTDNMWSFCVWNGCRKNL